MKHLFYGILHFTIVGFCAYLGMLALINESTAGAVVIALVTILNLWLGVLRYDAYKTDRHLNQMKEKLL